MSAKNHDKLLEEIYQRAYDYERKYGYCPQAVLAAIQDFFPIIDDQVLKSSQPLAAGGALCSDGTCGGLAGGMIAIGCVFGRSRKEFKGGGPGRKSAEIARKLRQRFIDEFGSVICGDVQTKKMGRSFDLWDTEDYKEFEKAGAHEDKCPDVTGKAAAFTAEILLAEGVLPKES